LVFQCWVENEGRKSALPFDELVAGVRSLDAKVPEVSLEPDRKRWPRPEPIELRAVDGRSDVSSKSTR
jgi:hypothetical protein